jgi:hypothetical protein
MTDYNSKYTGEQVEEFLDQIANGDIGGGIETETDPIFSASPAATITDAKKEEWDNKVDKVSGKQLSTEDFTSALKTKLEGLSNYDDTELSNALSTLRGDFDKLVSGDTTTAIKTFNEVIAFLEGIQDTQDLSSIIASIEQQIAGKQGTISDLDAIREGASKGATALQSGDIPEETYLADFTMFSLRQGMNNGGHVNCDMNSLIEAMTANKTILVREDEESDGYKGVCVLNGYAEDLLYFSIVDHAGDILYCEGTNYTNTSSYIDGRTLYVRRWDDKADSKALSTVATSGSYNDLTDRPTIPSAVTEATVSGWGFTKNTGTYSKPSGGIPKSDLASAVQTSLGKADTALQSYTEQYKGTITGVSANGTSVATSGVANIPAASTSKYGVTKLSSATNSTSTTLAATASAVKSAYDLANGKQDKLVSGTNIKTINGTSLLGSGDIVISGGGGSSSGGNGAYLEVDGSIYESEWIVGQYDISDMQPNTFYVFPECNELVIQSFGSETAGIANEFLFQFTSGSTPTTLSLPNDIRWANDTPPTIEANKIYQISILKGLGSVLEFDNAAQLLSFMVNNYTYHAEVGMSWRQFVDSIYNISTSGYSMPDFHILDDIVTFMTGSGMSGTVQLNNANVLPDSLIIENTQYDITINSGGFE